MEPIKYISLKNLDIYPGVPFFKFADQTNAAIVKGVDA